MEEHFIREKIVGPKGKWKKRLKKAVLILLSGGLFGIAAAFSFFFLGKRLSQGEAEQAKESIALVEESTEAASESTAETEAIEDVVQSELQKFDFSVSSYDSLMSNAKTLISEGEKSLVEVSIHTPGEDSLSEANQHCTGVILKKTKEEAVILFLGEAKAGAGYEVTFNREKKLPATLRGKSGRDRWVVLTAELSSLTDKEWEKIQEMPRGNSRLLQRGETLVGIGSPSGQLYSTLISYVSYLSYETPEVDRFMEEIAVQGEKSGEGQVFYLDTNGAWVGFSAGEEASFPHLYGISDYLDSLEALSNGKSLAYLGLRVQNATKSMVKLGVPEGIYISEVEEGSPAFSAGVQAGDILKKVDGKELPSVKDFEEDLLKKNPGDTVRFTVLRNNGNAYVDLEFSCPLETR